MTRFVIHARRFAGSLAEPTCNETASDASDDYRDAVRLAEQMSHRGWSVWVFEDVEHGLGSSRDFTPSTGSAGGGWLRTVGEWRPGGSRVR